MDPINVFCRDSYLSAPSLPPMPTITNLEHYEAVERDTDDSEEHVILVIEEYKRIMSYWNLHPEEGILAKDEEYAKIMRRGLAIEEGILKNIREVNSAKSASVKKAIYLFNKILHIN